MLAGLALFVSAFAAACQEEAPRAAPAPSGVTVEVSAQDAYLPGLPLPLQVTVKNAGPAEVKVFEPSQKASTISAELTPKGAAGPLPREELRTYLGEAPREILLAPGATSTAVLDLDEAWPALAAGEYACRVHYRPSADAAGSLTSQTVQVRIAAPENPRLLASMKSFLAARAHMTAGRPGPAESAFAELIAADPGSPYGIRAGYLRGQSLLQLKRYTEAAAALEDYLKAAPSAPDRESVLLQLAAAYLELKDAAGARAALERIEKESALARAYRERLEKLIAEQENHKR